PPLPLVRDLETIEEEPDQSLITRRYTQEAVSFIEANAGQPFFLYYADSMPHVPIYASEDFAGSSEQGLYGDVIQEIDWSVGEVLNAVKKAGIDDNTLVVFTSDNGPWKVFGNHGGDCGGLRGRKGSTWECGIRVPFIARWPGNIPEAGHSDAYAMTIDLLPTIASLTQTTLPEHPIDGKNIWPLFTSPEAQTPHEALFFYYARQLQAIRYQNWKLHLPHSYRKVDQAGADGMPGTYTHPKTGLELYDLANDTAESENVAAQNPEIVAYLTGLADSVRTTLGDQVLEIKGTQVRPAGVENSLR
ncbi:MAG: sulfatase-like hydrolase/transferase, partial [Rhodothermales bacterium]